MIQKKKIRYYLPVKYIQVQEEIKPFSTDQLLFFVCVKSDKDIYIFFYRACKQAVLQIHKPLMYIHINKAETESKAEMER